MGEKGDRGQKGDRGIRGHTGVAGRDGDRGIPGQMGIRVGNSPYKFTQPNTSINCVLGMLMALL